MKTVCIVQARMGSARLPGKVLLPLNGRTVIGEVLSRCKRIPGVDCVAATVPFTQDSLPLEKEIAKYTGYIFSGTESDVLKRYLIAATHSRADIIVRVTGDCPLICPELCGDVVAALKRDDADYASNIDPIRTFPQGYDCEAFTYQTLSRADREALPHEREHVTTWMRRADIRRMNVTAPWPMEGRLTLDTEDDYKVICAAFGHEPYQRLRAA
jgi:spore coat polysaccharide biosynthesis protein SpsF